MGTSCELQLFAEDPAQARRAASRAIADVARLEARYSRYRESSFLSEINRVAGRGGAIAVDGETAALLDYAASCHRESEGLFDVTSGVLRRAWRFERGEPPDARVVEALLPRVGWHRLVWARPRLEFPVAGMELDLGGVVKEYAADRAAALCREAGVASGLVNLGGDIAVIGPRPGGAPWRIGIRHPRDPHALVTSVELRSGALASSGDYARCIVHEGQRYGHILNPRTGWPVRHLASASVAAELCVVAGSAATIAILHEERGADWLGRSGLPSHWVDVHGASGGSLAA